LHLHFIVLLRVFGNGNNAMGNPWKRKQEFKLGNVNEKEWGCKNPFPIISIEHAAVADEEQHCGE